MRIQTKRQTHGKCLPEQARDRKAKPNTVNPKLLAREQKANEKYVRERVRQLVSPDIFNRLSFKTERLNGLNNLYTL